MIDETSSWQAWFHTVSLAFPSQIWLIEEINDLLNFFKWLKELSMEEDGCLPRTIDS